MGRLINCVSQDKGESPKDLVYDCVLQGLNLVARKAALPLLDHLFTWRREALVRATRAGGEMMVLRKRVIRGTVQVHPALVF